MTSYLQVLPNEATAIAVLDDDVLTPCHSSLEAAAAINVQALENSGGLVLKFEVGHSEGSQLFSVDFSTLVDRLIAFHQTEDGRLPDPDDTEVSLELLARRLEMEAALVRAKLQIALAMA